MVLTRFQIKNCESINAKKLNDYGLYILQSVINHRNNFWLLWNTIENVVNFSFLWIQLYTIPYLWANIIRMIRWVPVPTTGTTADPSWCSVSFHKIERQFSSVFRISPFQLKKPKSEKTLYDVFNHLLNHLSLPLRLTNEDWWHCINFSAKIWL